MQYCQKCKKVKSLDEFYKGKTKRGVAYYYKQCDECREKAKIGKQMQYSSFVQAQSLPMPEILKPEYWITPPLSMRPEYQYDHNQ